MVKLSEVPPGALVVCEIFHLFEHTGIYIGDGQIVELQGTGLIRSVSTGRFMHNRSGEELLVACDSSGKAFANTAAAERAVSQIFTYQAYDLISNNCHRFCVHCLTGRSWPVTSFLISGKCWNSNYAKQFTSKESVCIHNGHENVH